MGSGRKKEQQPLSPNGKHQNLSRDIQNLLELIKKYHKNKFRSLQKMMLHN